MDASQDSLRPNVARLRDRPHADVLIIGAGINGIATFRDLALQGVDVALVERGDFVSGASSASSHMIHGGIRYLENGEFRLVQESVTERNRLLKTAPHYVRPLETTIPIFSTFSGILSAPFRLLVTHGRGKPRERGAALIKMGLMMYDTFSRDGGQVPRHRFHGKKKSLAELPAMNSDIKYTATYYDASMHDPERLALDVLRDGELAGGDNARAANYLSASGMGASGVTLRDETTGESFEFSAQVVLNTSGPWTDLTNGALGERTQFMGGTKGSHVVLDHPELLAATGGREIFFEHSDGRIVLIYPLKGRVLVGTTDIDADPSKPVVCTDDEVDYFFDLIGQVFPTLTVDRSHIVYSFSGIRPLPHHDDTAPGFVSRDYRIVRSDALGVPVLSLVGGKWTTFRALAEHLANDTLAVLGRTRTVSTTSLTIGGGSGFPADTNARLRWLAEQADGRDARRVETLLERYGTRATEIIEATPEQDPELADLAGYTAAELAHLAETEQVVHLDDLLLRRTSIAFVGGLTEARVRAAADAVATAVGWDEARKTTEVERFVALMRDAHRIDIAKGGTFTAG
ncbi:glycerol-3-phosphate dehydrogenase/oxidase [Leucobacter aridicollis]|uniref:Glycerol-3-phosphate dehydrogenase n=1 Tax=Leucobacter aridicollis TaxID=283878 RepID=A0A852R6P2_9MICO|nr:glycerol-3-phosphate dehydrogenase/oxidase [Leucobacter aridicollis]MBL3681815.1 glycerol-3-phosphate dehydrogenase/oxidase [Leucobacter aridicollis]NYD27145.1 glycerol-3-phosphate dehydrogenase [Leucobacter aridicollis]